MRLGIDVTTRRTSLQPGFFNQFIKANEKGNREAAKFLMMRCRENVSEPWPPPGGVGQFPRLRTGRGRNSIQVARIDEGPGIPASYDVFVAPPNLHLAWLELGEAFAWDRVTPIVRPWLLPTYNQYFPEIEAIRLGQIL